jgi:hypothetical protein
MHAYTHTYIHTYDTYIGALSRFSLRLIFSKVSTLIHIRQRFSKFSTLVFPTETLRTHHPSTLKYIIIIYCIQPLYRGLLRGKYTACFPCKSDGTRDGSLLIISCTLGHKFWEVSVLVYFLYLYYVSMLSSNFA